MKDYNNSNRGRGDEKEHEARERARDHYKTLQKELEN